MHYNKDSESSTNLKTAFEHESSGHVRYMILADNAEKNGKHDLAKLYIQLAGEEYAHAKNWYKEMHGEEEKDALKTSISEEDNESRYIYPRLAAKAELEGYEKLADMFTATGEVEGEHSRMLAKQADDTKNAKEDVVWRCCICGYSHTGTTPPELCPLCGYNKSVFSYS